MTDSRFEQYVEGAIVETGDDAMMDTEAFEQLKNAIDAGVPKGDDVAADDGETPPEFPEGNDGTPEEVEAEKAERKAAGPGVELHATTEEEKIAFLVEAGVIVDDRELTTEERAKLVEGMTQHMGATEAPDEDEYTPNFACAADAYDAVDWIWKRDRRGLNRRSLKLLGQLRDDLLHARDRELL